MDNERLVTIPSGQTFLVCKVDRINLTQINIYLREIKVGLNKNVVIWCDSQLSKGSYQKYHTWMNLANSKLYQTETHHNHNQQLSETTYILSKHSATTAAYLSSALFSCTLRHCDSLRLVQSVQRAADERVKVGFWEQQQ